MNLSCLFTFPLYCLCFYARGLDRGCPDQIEKTKKERKRSENKFVTSCVFGYWLGPCCCSGRSSHLSLVDFLPVGQPGKSGDISSTAEYSSSHSPFNLLFWFILLLVRRGICIFSWAGRKAVYRLDVAMFVSLIVTWWRCQSTSTCGNLIAPATWRTSSTWGYTN